MGQKNKRGGKSTKRQDSGAARTSGRLLVTKDPSPDSCELYAKVIKRNGGYPARISVQDENGIIRNCVVRTRTKGKDWMNSGDFVIIIYNKDSADLTGEIAYKYADNEVTKLKKMNHINEDKFKGEDDTTSSKENGFGFEFKSDADIKEDEEDAINVHAGINQQLKISELDGGDDSDEFDFEKI